MKAMRMSVMTRPSKSSSPPAAAGAATTRTFFTHCFGRSALIIASGRFFGALGPAPSVSAAPSASAWA